MKNKIVALLITILSQHSFTSGQTFAMAAVMNQSKIQTYSPSNFSDNENNNTWCRPHLGAVITLGIGSICIVGGSISVASHLDFLGSYDNTNAALIFLAGTIIDVVGTGILIGGVIHDNYIRRISLVSSKNNEMGLAYNF